MLLNFHVKNLALIDESDIYFDEGLNILSGETGAGKSIIIDSLNFALGGKLDRSLLRDNDDYSLVEAVFETDSKAVCEKMKELGISFEDGQIILSRKVLKNRVLSKINGENVSVSVLKEISGLLIDVHGQQEHQSLNDKRNHLKILDEFGKEKISKLKEITSDCYKRYSELKNELDKLSIDEESRKREIDFLEFEINEIESATLINGEDDNLEADYKKLSNGKKIINSVNKCHQLISEGNNSAANSIGEGMRLISKVAEYDVNLSNLLDSLSNVDSLLNDFSRELSDYISENEFSEEEFEEINQRLTVINNLKSKYGDSISDILASLEEKRKRLDTLVNFETYKESINKKLKNAEKDLVDASLKLSECRKKISTKLVKEITKALLDLNFLQVSFNMEFRKTLDYSANGFDDAEFIISTNPGENLKPLGKVASGGELSRIMLGIKTVLADTDNIDTLIFDEIDTGISGRTASMVAKKMAYIARRHQVICITHLAQIASMADSHFLIEKKINKNEGTTSSIIKLSNDAIITELSRLVGGTDITDAILSSAIEMKDNANIIKKEIEKG
ncbi:DNA repair protein RecN (Recombination protein N) [Acetitomaculum ruminis DSM 5522]|uniref:DNA repair protein RecN n=1 Tax=Acetitomaculum ruminis DSM 5522 TaxID=1120918 RepID=A0A1I0VSL9_9FIRM|nr:DNA repair protein RecN [Acetitomaculum ruminis]SFA79381.1 DNA repair protein RecN (Recombination protein N) [Acetitomaculum ruminis DSM 5522]